MTYPTLEQYQEALQHPANSFFDQELQNATIKTSGLGMPLALCGGFALTYTVTSGVRRYAVRCFHKESKALEARYTAISKRLQTLKSPYFVKFEFQPQGIRINNRIYPIVKMAWASGETLGEFLEANFRNKSALGSLRQSLLELASYLDKQQVSHGDIQTGNLMVADGGKRVQLIDYDGMYVDEIRGLGSSELGHRNFQHPDRVTSDPYDQSLDRFSFISLTMAIRALEDDSSLWGKSRSDIDGIVFRAGDFQAPETSSIFNILSKTPSLGQDIKNFASVCKAPFVKIPTLADFVASKNLPSISVLFTGQAASIQLLTYLGAYPVLNGSDFGHCSQHVGDRIELIGKIVEVKENKARNGKPYVFLNFAPWKGNAVKICIWSEGLQVLSQKPNQTWVGKWISVVGLMEPPYKSTKYQYTHLAITVSKNNEMSFVDNTEAEFRLAGSRTSPTTKRISSNEAILKTIGSPTQGVTNQTTNSMTTSSQPPLSANQALLAKINQTSNQPLQINNVRKQPQQPIPPQYGPTTPPKQDRGILGSIFDFFFK